MWRLIKVLLVLVLIAAIGVVLYAFVGPFVTPDDFAAPQREVVEPVDLGLD